MDSLPVGGRRMRRSDEPEVTVWCRSLQDLSDGILPFLLANGFFPSVVGRLVSRDESFGR
jgi:hypothetical protein